MTSRRRLPRPDLYSSVFQRRALHPEVKAFRTHLGMYLGGFYRPDVFNAVFTYYVIYVLFQTATVSSELLGIMSIMQLIAVLCMIPVFHWGQPRPIVWRWSFFALACLTYGFMARFYPSCRIDAGLGGGGLRSRRH